MRAGDAFQLGYLPHLVRAHFDALALLADARAGADGRLVERIESELQALPVRGPEIVSCVWQVAGIVAHKLRIAPPAEPRTDQECALFVGAAAGAFAAAPEHEPAYALGARAGAAEALLAQAARLWSLASVAPHHPLLLERAGALRRRMAALAAAPSPDSDCPTLKDEDAAIVDVLKRSTGDQPFDDRATLALLQSRIRIAHAARAAEAAAWGAPRESIRAWREKKLTGRALALRLAEHHLWLVPSRLGADGQPAPRILQFDKRVMFLFEDQPAFEARPKFLRDGEAHLTRVGAQVLAAIPDEVEVLVINAGDDPNDPGVINYPREMFAWLREVAADVILELAACDWSELDLTPLRQHRFWVVTSGGKIHHLLAPDAYNRPLVSVFSTEAALEAHLAQATTREHESWQRLPLDGETLFRALVPMELGVVLNPSGAERSRAFNRRTVEKLAET